MLGYHHAASGRCNTVVRLHQNCKRGTRMVVGNQRKPSMAIQSLDTNCKAAGTNSSCSGLKQHAEPIPIPPPQRNHAWILGLAIAVITTSSGAVGTAADIPVAADDRSSCPLQQQQHSGQVTPDLHRNLGDLSNEVPRVPELPAPPAPAPLAPLPPLPQQPHPPLIPSPMPPAQPPQLVPPCSPEAPPVRLIPNTPDSSSRGITRQQPSQGSPAPTTRPISSSSRQQVTTPAPLTRSTLWNFRDDSTTNNTPSSSSSSSRLLPLLTRRAQQQQQQRQWQQLLLWSAFSQVGSSSQLAILEAPALPLSGDGSPPFLQLKPGTAAASGDEWRSVQEGPAATHSSGLIIPNSSSSRGSGSISDAADAGAFLMRANWREGNAAAAAHQPMMRAELLPPLLHDHQRSPAAALPATSSLTVISADVIPNAMPAAAASAATSPPQQQQQQPPVLLSVTAGLLGQEDSQTGGSSAAELYDRVVGQRKEAAREARGMRLLNSSSDAQTPPALEGPVQDSSADLAPPPAAASPAAAPGGPPPEPQAKGSRNAFNSFQFVDTATQERLQADVEDFTSASSRFTQSLGKFFQLLFELVLKVATFTVKITVKLLVWLLDQAKQAQAARVQQARQQRTQLLAAPAALLQPPQPPLQPHAALQAAAPHSAASCI